MENPHAGRGVAVVLDIGGDIGALIVTTPADMEGLEVEIVPTGTRAEPGPHEHDDHHHDHDHGDQHHHHEHGHHHHHVGSGHHDHAAPPHVAVVVRPLPNGDRVPSLVFGSLPQGTYDLYVRPDGPVRLTATVRGGEVTQAAWPE